jgi:phosphoribosylanthranilate isomerase
MIDFKIKICGITSTHDAAIVVEAGADAIGLNFFPKSVRCVNTQTAREIIAAVEGRAKVVGLFVNSSWDEILSAHRLLGFDYIQLHGTELPGGYDEQEIPPIIRAFRWPARSDQEAEFIKAWTGTAYVKSIGGYLVDANISGAFGGTGERTDWMSLYPRPAHFELHPLILAGGLRPENIDEAIALARPDVVDTASGVEASPGKKDANKLKHFVNSAKLAFAKLKQSGESL